MTLRFYTNLFPISPNNEECSECVPKKELGSEEDKYLLLSFLPGIATHPCSPLVSLRAYVFVFFCFFFRVQMFGCGAVAQLVLSKGTHGMFLTVNFAFGFAATLGILVCGQISGKLLSDARRRASFDPSWS